MAASNGVIRLRAFLAHQLKRMAYQLDNWSRTIYTSAEAKRVEPWFRDQGDVSLRRDYALDANSLVIDLGGYEGQWSSDIFAMYGCTIHIFEPMPEFARKIEQRFARNSLIHAHALGLASETRQAYMSENANRSTLFGEASNRQPVRMERAADFFQAAGMARIDLMKVNIEGGEYELLDHLLATGWIERIVNLQVQFHDFVPEAEQRMRAIQNSLSQTHELTYQYPFVWENWKLRSWSPAPAKN